MKRVLVAGLACLLGSSLCLTAQAPAEPRMSEEQFRQYVNVLNLQAVDAKAVHEQMLVQRKLLPSWFPEPVWNEAEKQLTQVDIAAVEYPFVKDCIGESDARMMVALFRTSEGQAYGRRMLGLEAEDQLSGVSAAETRSKLKRDDPGLPASAIAKLDARDQARAKMFFTTPHGQQVLGCMNEGYVKSAQALGEKRTALARQVMMDHQQEIAKARQDYEAQHPTAPTQ